MSLSLLRNWFEVLRLSWIHSNILSFLNYNVYLFGFGSTEMDFHVILLNVGWEVKTYARCGDYEDHCLQGCDAA